MTAVSLAWAVASFLVLISYGSGFDKALHEAFRAIGQDIVFMTEGQTSLQAGGMRSGRRIRLVKDDVIEMKKDLPLIAAISPEMMFSTPIVRGARQKEYMLRAVWPEYDRIRNMTLESGRWITDDDDRMARRVAVLGSEVAREMFGTRHPLGQEITARGIRFTVIGVLKTKVQLANYNRPDNQCAFIPYETSKLFANPRYPNNVVWTPVSPTIRGKAVRQTITFLSQRHRFSPNDETAVFVLEFSKFTGIIDNMSIALNLMLIFIGTVTLAIGGVGLANIMFTAVLERTREIGVMKALGARRRTILSQFMLESFFVVLAGGLAGITLGTAIASAIGSLPFMGVMLGEELAKSHGRIHFVISPDSVLVSFGILGLVGIIAGILPAIRASRLDPVEALRFE